MGDASSAEGEALHLLADALRRPGGSARLRVVGDCMAPLVRGGDEVVLRGVAWPPAPGALVVAVSSSGAPVCHRVVEVDSLGEVRIAGDRVAATEAVGEESVLGVVVEVHREGRLLRLAAVPHPLDRLTAASRRWAGRWAKAPWPLRRAAAVMRRVQRLLPRLRCRDWCDPQPANPASSGGTSERSGPASRR